MNKIFESIIDYTSNNPIFSSELRRTLRQNKVFIIQTVYLSILSVVLYIVWADNYSSYSYRDPSYMGKEIFNAILFLQFLAVSLICPSFTCSDISSEVEKKSFDLLVTSLLSPKEIVLGKLSSTIIYIFLLLISSIPLTCTVFFFGGVGPLDIILGYLLIFIIAILYSMIGLFVSARTKKTNTSIGVSYGLVFILFIFSVSISNNLLSSTSFNNGISFHLFTLPFWPLFFFELLSIILLLFLSAAALIKIPFSTENSSLRKLFSVFYILNILLLILKWCDYSLTSGPDMKNFYHMVLFFSLVLLPFSLWPGDADGAKARIGDIFRSSKRFSMLFVPLLTLAGLSIALGIFRYFSIKEISSLVTASTIVILFVYSLSVLGRWVATFFEKEDNFIISFLVVCWVPILISFIIRNANANSEPALVLQVMDPFISITKSFEGAKLFVFGFSALLYFIAAFLFHVLLYIKWPVKRV